MAIKFTDDEIFEILSKIVINSLRVDPNLVTRRARLFYDLGAESIDILEIRFHIEEAFGFKAKDDELAKSLGDGLSEGELEELFTVDSLVEFVKTCCRKEV